MRRLDVLMLKSFIGPFLLTTAVSNFILLIQYLLKYFDDFVGKNLGFTVFAELLFYFSLNMLQVALPLGVLVASLMTFGNLGENFELTAIKGSGISLIRTLRPIFLFVVVLSVGAFFFNNYAIPAANLKAYSLLYDIKHTKPALDIKAGTFYNGIPDYSIKAKEKLPDGKTLLDVIIYDHTAGRGNQTVILADSSRMYTIMDERYLKLELYNGNYYTEMKKKNNEVDQLYRTEYFQMDMVFSLASFDLKRRKEELFQNNRQMKNISELTADIDSFENLIIKARSGLIDNASRYFDFHIDGKEGIINRIEEDTTKNKARYLSASLFPTFASQTRQSQEPTRDTIFSLKTIPSHGNQPALDTTFFTEWPNAIVELDSLEEIDVVKESSPDELITEFYEQQKIQPGLLKPKKKHPSKSKRSVVDVSEKFSIDTLGWGFLEQNLEEKRRNSKRHLITTALNQARNVKVNMQSTQTRIYNASKDRNQYTIEKYKKYAQALACILMFMIGAPLGAIIKKGGLGVPTIIAIVFFIVYYVFTSIGEKSAKEGAMNPYFAVWLSDLVLLPFGLFFLLLARKDARIFDVDVYISFWEWLTKPIRPASKRA